MEAEARPAIDVGAFRSCLGHFATGVTVVTCQGDGIEHGVTVNSFTSVSIDPPLVLVSISRKARAFRYLEGRAFVINVLRSDQLGLALHFAGRPDEHLVVPWEPAGVVDAPRLSGCLAWIECTPWQAYDGGDHVLFLGQVANFEFRGGEPLIFYRGRFRLIGDNADAVFPADFLPNAGWFGHIPVPPTTIVEPGPSHGAPPP